MSDYIFLMRGGNERTRSLDEAQMQDYMNQWKDYMGKLAGAGGLAGGAPLGAEARMIEGEAKSVSAVEHSGNQHVTGYITLSAEDMNAAQALDQGWDRAARMSSSRGGVFMAAMLDSR